MSLYEPILRKELDERDVGGMDKGAKDMEENDVNCSRLSYYDIGIGSLEVYYEST
ncbi:hypothetical protein AAC03nite_33460 [Alicyclobacillus acidoterrestris]|nr:hypothetical protein AAC03nite_33460 [Alicyclobacillus acidoterrestris]